LDKLSDSEPIFSIAAVEREVGLSKDVLRVWERRYGFPAPVRDDHGERAYPASQVRRLQVIRRLIDQGHRPGKLLPMPPSELAELAVAAAAFDSSTAPSAGGVLGELMSLVCGHDAQGLSQALQQRLVGQGLQSFVQDTMVPMTAAVGQAWADGQLRIFEEHLFTEVMSRLLRQAVAGLPAGKGPLVLLTTAPEEPHGLGLLMAEAMMALQGARCISLGTQVPLGEIARAAQAHRVDVVALSFSGVFPARQVGPVLRQLREALAETVQLWAGGSGVARLQAWPGVELLNDLAAAAAAVARWQSADAGSARA
jgi:MerR family transcriptional regulator, light-induced transcriptional regulator